MVRITFITITHVIFLGSIHYLHFISFKYNKLEFQISFRGIILFLRITRLLLEIRA